MKRLLDKKLFVFHYFCNLFAIVYSAEYAKEESDSKLPPVLFEGDLVPAWGWVSRNYGVEIATQLASNGVMSYPEDDDARYRWLGTSPHEGLWNTNMIDDYYVITIFIDKSYKSWAKKTIRQALKRLSKMARVIKFKYPLEKPTDGSPFLWIGIHGENRCASFPGRQPSSTSANGQKLWLAYNCLSFGIIQHEVLHALGFYHEHSRPDRDSYIDIYWENIEVGYEGNFNIRTQIDSLGSPYDYNSLMHYTEYEFSGNGLKTINSRGKKIGFKYKPSQGDLMQLRLMYQCKDGPRNISTYYAERCTDQCKCGRNFKGCNGYDDLCKGSLICIKNKCSDASK